MSCCDIKKYDSAFDGSFAQVELNDYLTTGLKKSSRPFFESLEPLPLAGHTLLDIGGGIGAVMFELLGRGIRQATYVDISQAYVDLVRAEAKRRAVPEKVESVQGNFPDIHAQISGADLVTLDKVLCCYPDFEELVSTSVSKARRWYIYSIPRDLWWVRLRFWYDSVVDWVQGRYLPVYYHPVEKIERLIVAAGFQKKDVKLRDEWRIALFEKIA